MVGLKQTSMKDSLENVARIGCLEFSGQKPLRRPCGTPTRSTPLTMGSSNWLSSLATTQAAGRHCASRLCWTSTSTTRLPRLCGKKLAIFQNKPWRGTFTNSYVSGPTSIGHSLHEDLEASDGLQASSVVFLPWEFFTS